MNNCNGYGFIEHELVKCSKIDQWVKDYLLIGDAKQINPNLYKAVRKATSVEEVLQALKDIKAIDYDWVDNKGLLTANSHRTAVNLFQLTKGETIEFRIFRASINPAEIYSSLMFCKRYIEEALKGSKGKPVKEILLEGNYRFARLGFDEALAQGWQKTRQTKGRCGPLKRFSGCVEPSEDVLMYWQETDDKWDLSEFDQALLNILELCKKDLNQKIKS